MRALFFSLILALGVCFSVPAYALSTGQTISSVTRINMSDGVIVGDRAEYTLELPRMWYSGYLIADRIKPGSDASFREKITFSYLPQDKLSKPVPLMDFYVYSQHVSLDPYGPKKILETNMYSFVMEVAERHIFNDRPDQIIFDVFLGYLSDSAWFADMIRIHSDQVRIVSDTVTVNRVLLSNPAMQNSQGVVYIPVRAACSALGYRVGWRAADSAVILRRGNEYHTLYTRDQAKSKYSTIIVSDRAYVSSMFFIKELNASIEVDNYNNVVISAKQ